MNKFLSAVSVLLTAGALSAGELLDVPVSTQDWLWKNAETLPDGSFRITGYRQLFSKKTYEIDPEAEYELSGEFQCGPGTEPSVFYFGFALFTKKNALINSPPVNIVENTFTRLAAPAAKGDTVLRVEDAGHWIPEGIPVPGAKEDLSDLPNFSFLKRIQVKSVSGNNAAWTVELSAPIPADIPSGTPIREHISGGNYHYAAALLQPVPKTWTRFSGKVKGYAPYGLPRDRWWPGTHHVQIMILGNYRGPKDSVLQIRNLKLEKSK